MLQNVMGRLNVLTPQELQMLDAAITPEVGAIVIKAFPELEPLIRPLMQAQAGATTAMPGSPPLAAPSVPTSGGGALGNMPRGGGY